MTIDPERLTAFVWRVVAGVVVGWVLSSSVVGWLAYRSGYAAGLWDGAAAPWL
jgi:hypothetical protein